MRSKTKRIMQRGRDQCKEECTQAGRHKEKVLGWSRVMERERSTERHQLET